MIKIEKARLKDFADLEDRVLWGVAYDSGEMTLNGKKWETMLALDELGWLHVWRADSEGSTKHARIPPDMIRIVFEAEAGALADEPMPAEKTDPNWRHPRAVKR